MFGADFFNKIKFHTLVEHFETRTYSLLQHVSATLEFLWVMTYHKYYDTEKYHIWVECMEFLEKRKDQSKDIDVQARDPSAKKEER